ncbi:MAG: hypothetical protein NC921_04070 [Candidatus Omnitrophica bacterium]|nr:hypothetical protein [Candidatus Omnitrophota bacterium]
MKIALEKIVETVRETRNITKTAKILGCSRQNIYKRLKKANINLQELQLNYNFQTELEEKLKAYIDKKMEEMYQRILKLLTGCQPIVNQERVENLDVESIPRCQPEEISGIINNTNNFNKGDIYNNKINKNNYINNNNNVNNNKNIKNKKYYVNNTLNFEVINKFTGDNVKYLSLVNEHGKMVLAYFYSLFPPQSYELRIEDIDSVLHMYDRAIALKIHPRKFENMVKDYIRRAKVNNKNITLQDVERWFFGRTTKMETRGPIVENAQEILKQKIEELRKQMEERIKGWKISST